MGNDTNASDVYKPVTSKVVESEARSVAIAIRGHNAVEHEFISERLKGMRWRLKITDAQSATAILHALESLDNVRPSLITQFRSEFVSV